MAIFPHLEAEAIVQVGDQTRLNASRSFVTPDEDAISTIEIQPEASADFYDASDSGYLDYAYTTAGAKAVTVRVTAGGDPTEKTFSVTVLSEEADALFASDSDLTAWEPDILNWVRAGRRSFKDVHREAQTQILDWLDEQGLRDSEGERLTAQALLDSREVREWAKFLALQIIFEGQINAIGDVFSVKAQKYETKALAARNRAELTIDFDGDGEADSDEKVRTSFGYVTVRRK